MAFGAVKIFPNDLRPRVAIGLDLPFNGDAVFISNYITKDSIKSNLINYFLTNPGERPANPTFGAGLRDFVFQQMTEGNIYFLKEDIQSKLSLYFPRVEVISLELKRDYDNNTLYVSLFYSIKNTNIQDNIELKFS